MTFKRTFIHTEPTISPARGRSRPLVSVVIVVRNAAATIAQAIQSVANLRDSGLELIVIDGVSTDGTIAVIRRNDEVIDKWSSEPDRGIYDAMNKGVACCTGEFVYFLGADDQLLRIPQPALESACDSGHDLVYGDVLLSSGPLFKSRYDWRLMFNNSLHHQGLFIRRTVLLNHPFDHSLRAFADFDLNQRLRRLGVRGAPAAGGPIALFNMSGVSNARDSAREFFFVIRKNHGFAAMLIAYALARGRGLRKRLGLP